MKIPRMTDWLLFTIGLLIVIYLVAPQQLPVSLYKLSLITMGAVAGYWIDRSLFPYSRPDQVKLVEAHASAMLRRAIIVGAAMVAVSLGV